MLKRMCGKWVERYAAALRAVFAVPHRVPSLKPVKAFLSRIDRALNRAYVRFYARACSVLTVPAPGTVGTQAGFAQALVNVMLGVIVLVLLITFLWQQGLPQVISASSNTTALTAAGADAATVSWATFIGKVVVMLLLIVAIIASVSIVQGRRSGGGGRRRRR